MRASFIAACDGLLVAGKGVLKTGIFVAPVCAGVCVCARALLS